jgi:hypothetical protein
VDVAIQDDWPRVRLAALAKIRNDALLARIAREARELDVRIAAAERISSERLLADLIREAGNEKLMGVCFSRITDRDLITSIAEDTRYSATARKLAIEHFADEGYLAEITEAEAAEAEVRKSEAAVAALLEAHGGGLRGVRAIGRFRRSEKALRALGTIARGGGETGGLAVEYLTSALRSANPDLERCAEDELSAISNPEVVAALVRALDTPELEQPIREVLRRIDTPEARAALGE